MNWEELTRVALLGTDRSQLSEEVRAELEAWGIAAGDDPEHLLAQAAAVDTQRRKAVVPIAQLTGEFPLPAPSPSEKYPPAIAERQLHSILHGPFGECLPEYLDRLRQQGFCLPTTHLPAFMQRKDLPEIWPSLLPLLGGRGHWLLTQHPDWQPWLTPPPESAWTGGDLNNRKNLLRWWRLKEPARALALLQSTWPAENAADKSTFLPLLKVGLSISDEPFLEHCLDEGRKEVRTAAAGLLERLPTSRWGQRMRQRAESSLTLSDGALRVSLPESLDDAARRDGLLSGSPQWPGGPKAACLGQVVSKVPPGHWTVHFGRGEAGVLDLLADSDWAGTLLEAVAKAAVAFKSRPWTDALLAAHHRHQNLPLWKKETAPRLAIYASPEGFCRFATDTLASSTDVVENFRQLLPFLKEHPSPWPDELVYALFGSLRKWMCRAGARTWNTHHLFLVLRLSGLRAPLHLAKYLTEDWDESSALYGHFEEQIGEMTSTLRFRAELGQGWEPAG